MGQTSSNGGTGLEVIYEQNPSDSRTFRRQIVTNILPDNRQPNSRVSTSKAGQHPSGDSSVRSQSIIFGCFLALRQDGLPHFLLLGHANSNTLANSVLRTRRKRRLCTYRVLLTHLNLESHPTSIKICSRLQQASSQPSECRLTLRSSPSSSHSPPSPILPLQPISKSVPTP